MKIEQLIREKVSFLSAGQKKVAEYILQHLDSFSYSTLAKLSKEISVSETTIIRLAYSLGFESFSEMQRTVQNDILSVPTVIKDDSLLDSGNFYQNIIANELHSMESWASHLNQEDMDQIVTGITLDDGEIHADTISYTDDERHNEIGIEIHSGKNRIVRRIFESLGYKVIKLDRVFFAGLTKKGLRRGEWRYLTEQEVNFLRMGSFE